MNRVLVALVLLQALVIAYLAFQLSERADDGGLAPDRPDAAASDDQSGSRRDAPRRPGTTADVSATRAVAAPESNPAMNTTPLDPQDPIGTIVLGSISRSDGAPLGRKPMIYFFDDRTGANFEVDVKESAYSIVGMRPGRYTLSARCIACRDIRTVVDIAATSAPQRFDVVFEPVIVVRLSFNSPDGTPLRKLIVDRLKTWDLEITAIATAAPPPKMVAATSSRYLTDFGIGRHRSPGGPTGASQTASSADALIEIHGPLPAYVSAVLRCSVLDTKLVSEPVESLEFTIPWDAVLGAMASLKATVVDADTGEPVTTARAALNDRSTSGGGTPVATDGSIHRENVRTGLLVFEVTAPGYATSSRFLRFEPGKAIDLGRIALSKGRSLAGIVLGPEGKPVAASVSWRNLDEMEPPQEFDTGRHWQSAEDGTFKIDPVGRGRIHLLASYPVEKPTASATLIVDTHAGSVDGVRIELQSTHEIILELNVARDRIFLFRVVDAAGRIWMARNVWTSGQLRPRLPIGDYTLEIYEDGRQRQAIPIAVRAGGQRLKVDP